MDLHRLALAQGFIESHTELAARELEILDPQAAAKFILTIPLAQAQRLLLHMLPAYSARIILSLPASKVAEMLANSNSNQIAGILRQLPSQQRIELIEHLPVGIATRVRRMLNHAEDTVGAWMTTDILLLPCQISAAEALQRIADAVSPGDANALPLVENNQKLLGFISVRDLLRAKSETRLTLLKRDSEHIALSSKMSLRAADSLPSWQTYDNLIVVNQRNQPEGLLRHVDLRQGLSVSRDSIARSPENILGQLGQAYLDSISGLFTLLGGEPRARRQLPVGGQEESS